MDLSLLWTRNRSLDRLPYLATGVVLTVAKYGLDWLVATQVFARRWRHDDYFAWPDHEAIRRLVESPSERTFALTLLAIAVPFVWIGVMLTAHRLRSSRLPVGLVALFFVPYANLALFFLLCLLPTRRVDGSPSAPVADGGRWEAPAAGDGLLASAVLAVAVGALATAGLVALGATLLRSYGWGLFVGVPFMSGLVSAVVFGRSRPQPVHYCIAVAWATLSVGGLALLTVAVEGLVCLLMAAPIGFALATIGAVVGWGIQSRPWIEGPHPAFCLALLGLLPPLMAVESAGAPEPELRAVTTSVVVAATPERVWRHVISFPPLDPPTELWFRAGIAYPIRAEIRGSGVGAVRYCVFSTGAFEEPIEAWEPPSRLAFGVTSQPPPMRELSPFDVEPPHLDGFLSIRRGEFRLVPLADGRTRLEGTTWMTHRMWPAAYWRLWSDAILHRVHLRVLDHVRRLAEAEG